MTKESNIALIPHNPQEDSLNRESSITNQLRGTARGKQTHIVLDKTLGQVEQTGLVIDGKDG